MKNKDVNIFMKGQRSKVGPQFLLLLISLLVYSCVPTAVGTNNSSTEQEGNEQQGSSPDLPTAPDFSNSSNYFQEGLTKYTTTYSYQTSSNQSFYLRGQEVDYFLRQDDPSKQCLILPYTHSASLKALVVALTPTSFKNIAASTFEYLYIVNPVAKSDNENFCQTPGVLSYISTNYPTLSAVFTATDVCSSCSLSSLTSLTPKALTPQGQSITDINLTNLKLQLYVTPSSQNNNGALSCQSTSECKAKGTQFDCCLSGQCVQDKSIKSTTNTSSTYYLQSLLEIATNADNIYNYPDLYHLCGEKPVTDVPTNDDTTDPEQNYQDALKEKKALYDCITPVDGEMSYCQKTIENVQTLITTQGHSNFFTDADDLSFATVASGYSGSVRNQEHGIQEVVYAGTTLFANNAIVTGMTLGVGGNGKGNDDLTSQTQIGITHTPGTGAPDDSLKITYAVNGTCEKINSFLAKCDKYFVQGQDTGSVMDHSPASNDFNLPYYAKTDYLIEVQVSGQKALQGGDWDLVLGSPTIVRFQGAALKVKNEETVKLTFYVDLTSFPNLMNQKQEALDQIKSMCGSNQVLKEVIKDGSVVNYSCASPEDETDTSVHEEVTVTAKNIPMRFYDQSGKEFKPEELTTSTIQEGTEFKYEDNNTHKPNNVNSYIGINEIYGQQSYEATKAKPPIQVSVTKGNVYDITASNGSFSGGCQSCGNDYYSNLVKLFPSTFDTKYGGGYAPSDNNSTFVANQNRRDDQLFGRACFVPVTMLPWSHSTNGDLSNQRKNRLATQHFYYANGAGRDWYGFDYGSLIGSFDGAKWFSVGNKRRIKATSNVLYLAINAIAADQNATSSHKVIVHDAVLDVDDYDISEDDYTSSGAQCQSYHTCEVDRDCLSSLGPEYFCEDVTGVSTSWPVFDNNGKEVAGDTQTLNLVTLLGTNLGDNFGGRKRCVYRARGSACDTNIDQATGTYHGTAQKGFNTCSSNTYCQQLISGAPVAAFNDRIARFPATVAAQNNSSDITETTLDLIGLGARTLGRPYEWQGTQTPPLSSLTNLNALSVEGLCIPGRSSVDSTMANNASATPQTEDYGDQITGYGVTPDLVAGSTGTRSDYLSRCSIYDSNGEYLFRNIATATLLSDASISNLAATQAMSTNALGIFEQSNLADTTLIRSFENDFIDTFSYQQNRCLRAPGATCFSDLECAPNAKIASQLSSINSDDTSLSTFINALEIQFWQEELVCAQEYEPGHADYNKYENRCCRETGQTLTIGSAQTKDDGTTFEDFNPKLVPGVSISLSSTQRYSRVGTVSDLMNGTSAANYPALAVAPSDECASGCGQTSTLEKQFNTFAQTAARTCCSKNWIREFHQDENGGGHIWSASKMQHIPKESFRCYNWASCSGSTCGDETGDGINGFTCSHVASRADPNCRAKSPTNTQRDTILAWIEKFELTGIGQIAIEAGDHSDIGCTVDPTDQSIASPTTGGESVVAPDLVKTFASESGEYTDGVDRYFSAADSDNFNSDNIKKIFSQDRVSCCLPAGTDMGANGDSNACCSGFINGQTRKCALPDYADVSVYLNRYISSEADSLAIGLFDSKTGYIKSKTDVINIACAQEVCASGVLAEGISHSKLPVRGTTETNPDNVIARFVDGDYYATENYSIFAKLYDLGLRWDNHLYCVPANIADEVTNSDDNDLIIHNCNN